MAEITRGNRGGPLHMDNQALTNGCGRHGEREPLALQLVPHRCRLITILRAMHFETDSKLLDPLGEVCGVKVLLYS